MDEFKKEFNKIYQLCKPYTMTSKENMCSLYNAVRYLVDNKIPGDFVECGVWKGGSAMIMAYTLALKEENRRVYLYDTFTGMAKPTEKDYNLNDKIQAINKWEYEQRNSYNNWCYSSFEEVKANLLKTGFPEDQIVFVEGKVENSIPYTIPSNISLLRLDTDWYESTKHELKYLYPVLSEGGVLILDDYGYWAGAKKAVDEYFEDKRYPLLNRIDSMARIGIKIP